MCNTLRGIIHCAVQITGQAQWLLFIHVQGARGVVDYVCRSCYRQTASGQFPNLLLDAQGCKGCNNAVLSTASDLHSEKRCGEMEETVRLAGAIPRVRVDCLYSAKRHTSLRYIIEMTDQESQARSSVRGKGCGWGVPLFTQARQGRHG